MKININKLQSGGLLASYGFVPGPASEDSSKASSSGSKKTDSILSSELLNKIEQEGLQNEVSAFFQALDQFELAAAHGQITAGNLAGLRSEANRILRSQAAYNDAKKRAEKEDALDDYAIDQSGYIYAFDKKGNIQRVEFSKFDRKKYQPLSISELLTHREWNPKAAWNTSMINAIASTTSMEKINDFIGTVLSKVKDTENKQEAWTTLQTAIGREAAKGKNITQNEYEGLLALAQLQEQVGSDALLKEVSSIKSPKIQQAIQYLYSIMPKNMKQHLIGSYVAEGGSYKDAVSHTYSFLINALDMGTSQSYEHKYSYDSSVNKDSSGSGGSSKTFYQTPNEAFLDGDLNQTEITIRDNTYGNESYVTLKGVQMPGLTSDNGNAISNVPLGIALSNSLLKYTNRDKIYMGDKKISEGMLNNIAYSGEQVAAIYMPVKDNGDVDWDGFHGFSKAEQYIKENNITDIDQKNMIHARCGSYGMYDRNGEIKTNGKTARYLLTYGYTIDDHAEMDNNTMGEELTGQEEKDADLLISQIYNKHLKNTTGISGIREKNIWDDIYKVPIFIKLDDRASMDAYRYGGHGSNMTPRTLEQDMMTQVAQQAPSVEITSSTNLLFQ